MRTRAWNKAGFVVANVAVMVILHGNSRQPWPRIPYLSLRNESEREHARLVFNTLAVVTLGQVLIGRMQRSRLLPRIVSLIALPGRCWDCWPSTGACCGCAAGRKACFIC